MKHITVFIVFQLISFNALAQFGNPQEILSFPEENSIENLQYADVDNDGDDDFLFQLLPSNNLYLLKNNFPFSTIDTTVLLENGEDYFEFAEINNDGATDIVFAAENDSVSVLVNDGSGNFTTIQTNLVQYEEGSKFGDIDGDGDDDYLTIDYLNFTNDSLSTSAYKLWVLNWENDLGVFPVLGDTSFSMVKNYVSIFNSTYNPLRVDQVTDFDQDGIKDVIIYYSQDFFSWFNYDYYFQLLRSDGEGVLITDIEMYQGYNNGLSSIQTRAYDFGFGFPDGNIDFIRSYLSSSDGGPTYTGLTQFNSLNEIDSTITPQFPQFSGDTGPFNDYILGDVFRIARFIEYENNGLGDVIEYAKGAIYFHQQVNPYQYDYKQWIANVDSLGAIEQSIVNEDEYGDLLLVKQHSIAWMENLYDSYQTFEVVSFWDENENGLYEEAEIVLENPIQIEDNEVLYSSNNQYGVYLADTVNVNIANMESWTNTGAQTNYELYLDSIFNDSILYFPLVPLGDFVIQDVEISASPTRCNKTTNYWITYTNEGTVTTDGYVQLIPDILTTFVEAFPPADSTSGDTLYWFYEDLHPTFSKQIVAQFDMPGVEAIDSTILFEANIETWEDTGNDKDIYSSILTCAYDPNDKLVSPEIGYDNYTLFEDTLEYTIRFQNTGNDTAFQVRIIDRLDENLDLNTFNFVGSSHPVETALDLESRLLEFTFNDIYLPDSLVNEAASHGLVKFQIQPKDEIEEFTVVENRADIIFDFNPPIVTNNVVSTMVSVLPAILSVRIFLEGPMPSEGIEMSNQLGYKRPTSQPYNESPYNYNGDESIESRPDEMIDWVLVEARTGTPNLGGVSGTELVETKAGLLFEDGSIKDINGLSDLAFFNLIEGESYYFAIRHRNHLDVLTASPLNAGSNMKYDFTTAVSQAYGEAQQKLNFDGAAMLWAGDINGDGLIQTTDYDIWFLNSATSSTYHPADLNLDRSIQTTDYDLWYLNNAKVGCIEIQY